MKVASLGSIYFDFKAQGREENRRVVCFSPSKRSMLKAKRGCRNARSPCLPESAKGKSVLSNTFE